MSTSSMPAGDLPAGANVPTREQRFRDICHQVFKASDALSRASDALMGDPLENVFWDYIDGQFVRVIDALSAARCDCIQLAVEDDDGPATLDMEVPGDFRHPEGGA